MAFPLQTNGNPLQTNGSIALALAGRSSVSCSTLSGVMCSLCLPDCYAMPGTDQVHGATTSPAAVRFVCMASASTVRSLAMRGTDVACSKGRLAISLLGVIRGIILRARYAMPGTDIASGLARSRFHLHSTPIPGSNSLYAPTPCPVLTLAILLPGALCTGMPASTRANGSRGARHSQGDQSTWTLYDIGGAMLDLLVASATCLRACYAMSGTDTATWC
eukprot:535266-Rhodomonas_salina.3